MIEDDRAPDRDRGSDAPDDAVPAPVHPLELALRYGLRYSGLRDVEVDPRLLLYVPLDVCERETVVALGVDEHVLEVAIGRPEPDLAIVQERFPNLEIELVFAPLERIAELHDELKVVR